MSETCRGSDKVRVAWVDAARVIAMFAVMQNHAYIVKDALHSQQHLAAGAVGLFFLLAGYFAHFKGWTGYCRRIVALVCFYVFYALYALFVVKHGAIFDWRVIFAQLLHPSGSPLWFIQYLLLATLALPVLDKMNGWVSAIVAVILQVWGCCDICTRDYTHVCMSLPFAMSLYMFGNCVRNVNLERLISVAMLRPVGIPPYVPFIVGIIGVALIYAHAVLNCSFLLQPVSVWIFSWSVFAICRGCQEYMPRMTTRLAMAGGAVVFVYGMHMPTLRIYTSAVLRLTGAMPAPWLDCVIILAMMLGCSWLYYKLVGRSKWLDAFMFAK